ncbi:presqualene diphosphate synthase HpnD [Gluconobacter wancherniae]|uniref:Squalene synthase HpnD n=1 Tax=Gluconobacter wancherniae NBRC 103581 TaxID=656744 RepID=A0A511B0U6_9PROT|nr:presqualene diphosphate synthase HpnD [Gluconobacter wancherniae]MBF0853393.1 presqualene diphosphate synthase HpnD [Gluconobacter wancherniae]GBD55874.1 squalene synthase HpnD [Gluconobacter wancherniae NBRC 103581]GBR65968.1 phytoene synthase [Gluconobacter wancherniae NBRC 103581]GEK93223.1 squalene synthase HpnD [Gluconobacter wancherniae NBRC 103581]
MAFSRLRAHSGLACAQADLDHVEQIVTASGTSFSKGMRILPAKRRQAMFAIYAFCREVDDIADGDTVVEDPAAALEDWHTRVDRIFTGEARDALDRVLIAAINAFDLKTADFHAVIDGMAMDTGAPIVAPDEKTLDLYCDRVASAVGRLSVRAFGAPTPDGEKVAFHLGRALQLTNILRDISEDASRGRLYLPKELLERFSVPLDAQEALYAHGLDGVGKILAKRARDHFSLARRAMAKCPSSAMRPARMMAASYEPILNALERRGWRNPDVKPKVSKVWRGLRTLAACAR